NSTEKRSEGVQCTSPPVDKGTQTTDLRLPRKSPYSRSRILHPRPASDTCRTGSVQAKADRNYQPRHVHIMTATVIPGTNMAEGTETEEPDYPKCDAGSEGGGAIRTKVLGIADG
ncbi:unnamed protein product, partial [Sphacelaria rigidula]